MTHPLEHAIQGRVLCPGGGAPVPFRVTKAPMNELAPALGTVWWLTVAAPGIEKAPQK